LAGHRAEGWEERLAALIADAQTRTFVWGQHDCATFAFEVRATLTGDDSPCPWAGRYTTAAGSERWLKRSGLGSMEEAVTHRLGPPEPPLMAQRGDIVLHDGALGVCIGRDALFLTPDGMTPRPMADIKTAWRV